MSYCDLLPFIESHQWEIEPRLSRIDSPGFAEWCDYVARALCARLIGYFYTDCPLWVHTQAGNKWRGAPRCLCGRLELPMLRSPAEFQTALRRWARAPRRCGTLGTALRAFLASTRRPPPPSRRLWRHGEPAARHPVFRRPLPLRGLLENNARRYGFRNEKNEAASYVAAMMQANRTAATRFAAATNSTSSSIL